MPTCHDVANYFLSRVREDYGDTITHLKIQKLVYYAQAFHLAITEQPLFEEEIRAWEHGPVTPDLYQTYREYHSAPIPCIESGAVDDRFTPEQLEILNEVHEMYGQFSAWKLRNLTHDEKPWNDAYPSGIISQEAMKDYFKNLLV